MRLLGPKKRTADAFFAAVQTADLATVERMLKADRRLARTALGWPKAETALHVAAALGYVHVAECLVRFGANVNARRHDGWTPLHSAAFWNARPRAAKFEVAHLLVKRGAKVNAKCYEGLTSSDLAVERDPLDRIGRFLRSLGAWGGRTEPEESLNGNETRGGA